MQGNGWGNLQVEKTVSQEFVPLRLVMIGKPLGETWGCVVWALGVGSGIGSMTVFIIG
jgi:hypothetical protein